MPDEERGWCLVVPVKRLDLAKTRLGPPYDAHRRALALAFALDTTAAALASEAVRAVLAVTDEPQAAELLAATGVDVVGDEPDAGLNPALRHGAALASAARPGCALGALSADLPALRPEELTRALRRAAPHVAAFLRDAEGTGTSLLLARDLGSFHPGFGADSARRHAMTGAVELLGDDLPTVRHDVDTTADLVHAMLLGAGPRTTSLVESLG